MSLSGKYIGGIHVQILVDIDALYSFSHRRENEDLVTF